jgi:hypothetical protein
MSADARLWGRTLGRPLPENPEHQSTAKSFRGKLSNALDLCEQGLELPQQFLWIECEIIGQPGSVRTRAT